MNPTTDELIKEYDTYFDDDSGSDDENYCKGRLQGRLDVLMELSTFIGEYDKHREEIAKIKEVLK